MPFLERREFLRRSLALTAGAALPAALPGAEAPAPTQSGDEAAPRGNRRGGGPAPFSGPEAEAKLTAFGKRDLRVHDPSTIVKCKDEYWLFRTGRNIPSAHSNDLVNWTAGPAVFSGPPAWVPQYVPDNNGSFWAPDVIHLDGRYLLFYSVSMFGSNTSAIALAANATLDPADPKFGWEDKGVVIFSQRGRDNFNAIDPAVTIDADGKLWMSFGSFWSGIKLVELDRATGWRIRPDSQIYALASNREIEAPFIYRNGKYYYLFASWGLCCRGLNSTYDIRVGRSETITGPYLDKTGADMARGGGSIVATTDGPFIGPGHAGILDDGGKLWFACHYYDGTTGNGASHLSIRPLSFDADGWPVAGLHAANTGKPIA